MEEKTIISSKRGSITKIICLTIVIIGIVAFAVVWTSETDYGFYADRIARAKETGDWNYVLTSMLPYFGAITFLPALVIAAILYFGTARCSMTITDKRVYGNAAFGKRVDLPLDSISAVGTSAFKGLAVATSSGRIKFYDIANQGEMHQTLSNLLIGRQDSGKHKATTTIKQEIPQSNADELKKYKDLLDAGVITQDEFDAKKKSNCLVCNYYIIKGVPQNVRLAVNTLMLNT